MLHIFRSVCNLIDDEGAVLSIVRREVGNGPFSALVEEADFGHLVEADSQVRIEGSNLRIGSLALDFADVSEWNPSLAWGRLQSRWPVALKGLTAIEELVGNEGPPLSLAELVLKVPQNFQAKDPVFVRSGWAIQGLFQGLRTRNIMTMRKNAGKLAGLGLGLTPAGDDFLIGSILALWACLAQDEAEHIGMALAEEAAPRTNSLSAAWLRASARGEAAEHWHLLFSALAAGNVNKLHKAARAILPTGHTSGADSLGGFVATVRLLSEEQA